MGANHNTNRYGELWPDFRIKLGLEILEQLKSLITISGGWAWHFMSVKNHIEYKHAHDHKDIDIFVHPKEVAKVMCVLLENGFEKVWTRYDYLPSQENFRRYEKKEWLDNGKEVRITIDFFESKTVKTILVDGWKLVEPKELLSYYSNIHSSDKCWAVKKAVQLIKEGKNPIGNALLSKNPLEKRN